MKQDGEHRERYNSYMRDYMLRRYYKKMEWAGGLLGGKCAKCGAVDDLEIDHIERRNKAPGVIGKIYSYSQERLSLELKKCQILCGKCHSLKTIEEKGQVPAMGKHGTLSSARYCKPMCDLCKSAVNKWAREWKYRTGRVKHPLGSRPPYSHGDYNSYRNGCRCQECKAANAKRHRFYIEKLRADNINRLDSLSFKEEAPG